MSRTRAAYPPEFRRQMVELVRAGRSPEALAREFEPTAAIDPELAGPVRARGGPWQRRPDDSGARGTQPAAAREPPAQAGAGNPLKGGGLVRSGDERDPTEGFRFVSDHQAAYPIATMCRLLGVSPSGYHAWVKRRPSRRSATDAALIAQIRAAHEASRGSYGAAHSCRTCGQGHAYRPQAGRTIDDAGRSARCQPPPVRHHHGQGQRPPGAGSGRAQLRGRSARSAVGKAGQGSDGEAVGIARRGRRHHLHSDLGRLSLSRRRARCV